MDYLPIFAQLHDKPVLVVGGGDVALRKIKLVLAAGARVTVLARTIIPSIRALPDDQVRCLQAEFGGHPVAGYKLIVAATDIPAVNRRVHAEGQLHNIWVNAVDDPDNGDFIMPAIVDRSPLVMAISSGGKAPVLARMWREKLEQLASQSTQDMAKLAAHNRSLVKSSLSNLQQRRDFWERFFAGPALSLLQSGKHEQAQQLLNHELAGFSINQGEVYLVGAGPGDPELLTIKAMQYMQKADVIVHDGLVSEAVLELSRRDAERISVAKKAGLHSMQQNDINQLLVQLANEGKRVCRLKGGDPFIYGRGGEECQALKKAGVRYFVVPGITAAAGCAAYAGIPLTHRDYAQTLHLVTGHCQPNGERPDWLALARSRQTLVVYMGLITSEQLSQQLIRHGRSETTPVAVIENGTLATQRRITGNLEHLPDLIRSHDIKSPALIVIGEVVALASELSWFQQHEQHDTPQTTSHVA